MIVYDLDCDAPLGTIRGAALLTFQDGLIIGYELFYDARPFEEKKILEDIEPDPIGGVPPAEIITTLPVVDDPIHPIKAED